MFVVMASAKQPVPWFIGGKGLGIQQGMNVWVGSPKPSSNLLDTCPRMRFLSM